MATLVLASGCSGPAAPDLLVEPIQIDSVEVIVMESAPPLASAHVRGILGDGCSTLQSVTQARSGNAVTLTILRQRPKDAICTQIAKLYDAVIRLDGQYPQGRYTLRVNGFEVVFETE